MATCGATVGDLIASGDNLYGPRSCVQSFIDWVWDAYAFDKGDWDDGFGWEAACDLNARWRGRSTGYGASNSRPPTGGMRVTASLSSTGRAASPVRTLTSSTAAALVTSQHSLPGRRGADYRQQD